MITGTTAIMLSQVSLGSVEDRNEIGNQPWRRFRTCPQTARDPKKFPEGPREGVIVFNSLFERPPMRHLPRDAPERPTDRPMEFEGDDPFGQTEENRG